VIYFEFTILFYFDFCYTCFHKNYAHGFSLRLYAHISCAPSALLACLRFSFVCYRMRPHRMFCYDNFTSDAARLFRLHAGTDDDLCTFLSELLHTASLHRDVCFSCYTTSTTVCKTSDNTFAYVLFRTDSD